MLFVLVGVLFVVLKVMEIAPVAGWGWLGVLTPFGCAVVWWYISDVTGKTKRDQMRKMDERKEARRLKSMEALGTHNPKRRR